MSEKESEDSVVQNKHTIDNSEDMGSVKSKLKKLTKQNKDKFHNEEMEIAGDEHAFMCGVVEGFYGRPWTAEQRRELFRRMEEMGLNTYLYAPKDDYKHRLFWREKYSTDEAELLKTLIVEAEDHGVLFVYAISPGLDMVFASSKEVSALKEKLLQVKGLGCKAFALLFDDIDPVLCATDMDEFQSSADAQASITNQMFTALDKPRFLFCPTEYCNNMAVPDVNNSSYLKTIGSNLHPQISVMWTGAKVVSNIISVESIISLNKILRRKVMIWDNIHANDYDPKRVFLGPYKGRSTLLIPHISGVLTNPNCEFESNFIAMHTIATWWKSFKAAEKKDESPEIGETSKAAETLDEPTPSNDKKDTPEQVDVADSESISSRRVSDTDSDTDSDYSSHEGAYFSSLANIEHGSYNPDEALEKALEAWLPVFSWVRYPLRKIVPRSGTPPVMPQAPGYPVTTKPPLPDTSITVTMKEPISSVTHAGSSPVKNCGDVAVDSLCKNTVEDDSSKANNKNQKSVCTEAESAITSSIGNADKNTSVDVDMTSSSKESVDLTVTSECNQNRNDNDAKSVGLKNDHNELESSQMTEGAQASNTDVEMKDYASSNINEDKTLEEMQTSPKNTVTMDQMETEEIQEPSTPMMTDDPDSDVSMATAQSGSAAQTDVEDMATPSPFGAGSGQTETKERKSSKSSTNESETFVKQENIEISDSSVSVDMETTKTEKIKLKDPLSRKFESDPMTIEDLRLLAECFFLPYEHGHVGKSMVQKFKWLRENAIKLSRMNDKISEAYVEKALDWSERALAFDEQCRDVQSVFNKVCTCPNRALLYDIFPYLWDLKGVVTMLRSYVKWLGRIEVRPNSTEQKDESSTKDSNNLASSVATVGYGWLGVDPEPWVFRGGLSGEFQRLLPVSSAFDLFCQTLPVDPQISTFIVRPYVPADEKSVFEVCYVTHNDGIASSDAFLNYKQLPADRLVGALLMLSPEYCFVVEDEGGLCGYLAATLDAKKFWKKYEVAYLPEMREKYEKPIEGEAGMTEAEKMIVDLHSTEDRFEYGSDDLPNTHPSFLTLALHPRANANIAKSMLVCLLSALKSHHSSGVHTLVPVDSLYFYDLYTKLGFTKVYTNDDELTERNVKILGRTF